MLTPLDNLEVLVMTHGNDIGAQGMRDRAHSIGQEGVPDPSESEVSRDALKAALQECKAIAKNIAQDAKLEVSLGEPGTGSYCQYGGPSGLRIDRVKRNIVIDPQHLLDEGNKFVIAHEGMHAYLTRSAFDYHVQKALKKGCDPEALYAEVGFASLLNFLEDCGGNDWLTTHYPVFEEPEQKLYNRMLHAENPEMHTGETQAVTARLGFYPRFAQFGSELMKRWHTDAYSTTLNPAVEDALSAQQANADAFIAAFPQSQTSTDGQRDALFCKRFLIAANKIMPTLRKLIDQDKAQAALQQLANQQAASGQPGQPDGQQTQQGGQQSQPGQSDGQQTQQGGQQSQPGQQQPDGAPSPGSAGASGASAGSFELSPGTKAEIDQKTAEHREKLREQLNQQLDELEKHLGLQGGNPKTGADAQAKDPSQRIKDLQKAIDERFDGQEDVDAKADADRYLNSLKELSESIDSQAAPIEELSPDAQQELQEIYDGLSQGEKRSLEEKAEELLNDFEDAIREGLEGKTQQDPAPTHRQQKQAKEDAKRAATLRKQIEDTIKRAEEERRSRLSEWDAAREDVGEFITKLHSRLERVLRPAVPEWETGHSTGNRISPSAAMQAKADPRLKGKMWEQRSMPIERSFVFSLLVDNSGSMGSSKKYLHARRCAVLLSEVLTRLQVPYEISIFSNGSEVLKHFDKKPKKAEKNQIAAAINGNGGGTEDYKAIQQCVTTLATRSEENKFLIVLTDGGSNDSTELVKTLQDALRSNIRVVGLGVGDETSDVDEYYPLGRGGLTLDAKDKENALGPYFANLLEEILKNPEQVVSKALRKSNTTNGNGDGGEDA